MTCYKNRLAGLGCFSTIARASLLNFKTPLEAMPNLTKHCGGANLFVKRDDCTGLAFGGNKVRQLEFYFGAAVAAGADTILITSALQSNYVRVAAAAACKLGMKCHVQLEERVDNTSSHYRESGNVLLDKLLGATIHSYPDGEDEAGADRQLSVLAGELRSEGRNPYIIPLAPGHPPLGACGYIEAAAELLEQIDDQKLHIDRIFVGSGSGATHAGLLFGLRALGSRIPVTGVCVRRDATVQCSRIQSHCKSIAAMLATDNVVTDEDIETLDDYLAPGYGVPGDAVLDAIVLAARSEGLITDPVYTGKVLAATLASARTRSAGENYVFLHTGGTPAIFAYQDVIQQAAARITDSTLLSRG